ncbi:PspA/IM30 family protein [Escherichia coli]|nr:PspA/IM30 family protein [Escherichia coli]
MNERLKTHSKTQKKSADLVSNKLRIGVFQQYQMKCKSVSKKSPRYTRVKLSHDKLKDLRERKASLEARALEALSKNVNPSLINEVAEEIARLENLITAEEQVLSNLEVSRDGVEKAVTATAQRIAQFEQQMEVVKATEAMQRAQQAVTTSTVGASSSVSTAAESLKRLQTRQAERQARLDAAAQLEKVADGRDLDEKLAEAGIGGSNKSSAQDVLARLQRQQGE